MRRPLATLIVLLWLVTGAGWIRAADEISAELVGLNVSLAAEKQLVVYEQLIAAEEWTSAIDLLDRLSADHGDVLVKVAPGRYVGLGVAIQQRLTQLPPAGLEVYRKRVSTSALALLTRARTEGDPAALWRLVEELAATPPAQVAHQHLADQAVTRGNLELALRLWGRLGNLRDPDIPLLPPAIFTITSPSTSETRTIMRKTIEIRRMVGVPLTSRELRNIDSDPLTEEATKENIRAGKNGSPTLSYPSLGPVRWSKSVTANCPLPQFQAPLSVTPGKAGLLLINNGRAVNAVQQETGEPFWPSALSDDVGILWTDEETLLESHTDIPCRIAGGVSTADAYFGVLGDAPRWRPRPGLIPLSGSMISLDLATGQGRLRWRVESRDLPEPNWQFHGGPAFANGHLPGDDLVIVPLCRPDSQVELAVAAYFADDGRLAWWSRIGTSAAEAGVPLPNTQLVVSAGLIVARTLTGVVVALDARHGRIQWASTAMVNSPLKSHGSPTPLLDARAGWLVVGDPSPSQGEPSSVVGLSLDSGEVLWRHEVPFPLQGVVYANPGKVLIAGKRLRAISLSDGQPLWEHGTDDPTVAGTGVPRVYNSTILWPTRTSVWGVDMSTGLMEFERRMSAEPIAQPVELIPTSSYWIISRPDAILCFPDSHTHRE